MALIQSTAIPSGATDYELEQSLKFNDNDSAYLSWTPASAGDRQKFTISCWLKRGNLSANSSIFESYLNNSNFFSLGFNSDDYFYIYDIYSGTDYGYKYTIRLRDCSAWYHILLSVDTTQSTATDRWKVYVNNERLTDKTSDYGDPALNYNTSVFATGYQQRISYRGDTDSYYDGYMAEFNLIDGQALTPADFGETGTYGEWKPIEYSGTYGTNGFYLNFAGGGVMSATGGTITTDGDYKVHSFTADGTFTPSADGYVEYLVIAGGGGGGSADDDNGYSSGGGGAGGYRTGYLPVTAQGYSITVGAGGAGGTGHSSNGTQGENSVFSTITSIGGGYGGTANHVGGDGGSGGGAAVGFGDNAKSGGSATSGQGYDGGGGLAKNNGNRRDPSGGGGGAGQVGYTGSGSTGGNGGNGLASSITGSSVTRAGGGAGDAQTGGSGGGGSGRNNGTANTGSGGGGSSNGTNHGGVDGHNYGDGGSGGSGIVIIRYKFQ